MNTNAEGFKIDDVDLIDRIDGDEKLPISDGTPRPLTISVDQLVKLSNKVVNLSTGEKLYIKIITGVHSKDAVSGVYKDYKIGPECLCFTTDGKIVFNNRIYG